MLYLQSQKTDLSPALRTTIEKQMCIRDRTYPNPLYEGETVNEANQSAYPSKFPEPLTTDLLTGHQEFSERCKKRDDG